MATKRQLNANRQNALLGGVKTIEGKDRSRLNAVKHGFFSDIVIKQDKVSKDEFCQDIYRFFSPENAFEEQLVEIVLSNLLAYRRISMVESNFLEYVLGITSSLGVDFNDNPYNERIRENIPQELLKFQRYKTCAFNLIVKTQHELERLRRMRKGENVPLPNVCDVNINSNM